MTPTAVTPAARRDRAASARPTSPHPTAPRPAHRGTGGAGHTPRSPRRVSGPARPAPSSAPPSRAPRAAAAPATAPRPAAPRAPRRISGPARPARPARRNDPTQTQPPLSARALIYLRGLPNHSLLDRVVRGRLWIPLLGVLLVGIVAMQVEVLKLNAGIGHSMVRAGQLQGANETLRADVSRLADDQRIESAAARIGMIMPAPSAPRFLTSGAAANLGRALANIHQPDATTFAATTSTNLVAAAASAQTTTANG